MKARVGLIVPFYNGHKYIDKLIRSAAIAGQGFHCKVFIIDNSPHDETIILPPTPDMPVEVIREKPSIGYGKACNRGFDVCRKEGIDFAFIINQDGYLSPDLIAGLLHPFAEDPSIMISAPLLKEYGNDGIEDFFVKYYLSQAPEMISGLLTGKTKEYYEMNVISGACFAFRVDDRRYPHAYLFDPVFHMYFEDEDLCRRVRSLKGKIVLVSRGAGFYHQHSHTTDQENMDTIKSDRLVGEKIYRLKDPAKSIARSLYGIFATTASQVIYHLLRGEGRLLFMEIGTSFNVMGKISRIRKTREQEVAAAKK